MRWVPRGKCVWPNLEAAFFPSVRLCSSEEGRRAQTARNPRANDRYASDERARGSDWLRFWQLPRQRLWFLRDPWPPSSRRATLNERDETFMRRACRNFRNVGVEQRGKLLSLELAQGRCCRSKIEYSSRGYSLC